jgi:hypothetical protein
MHRSAYRWVIVKIWPVCWANLAPRLLSFKAGGKWVLRSEDKKKEKKRIKKVTAFESILSLKAAKTF